MAKKSVEDYLTEALRKELQKFRKLTWEDHMKRIRQAIPSGRARGNRRGLQSS